MMLLRTSRTNLSLWTGTLALLIGLVFQAMPVSAQVPNAQTNYQGTAWYYYTGSPWTFPLNLTIYSQVTDPGGQWASLYGYLMTSSTFYWVSGTIWHGGWTSLYAYDEWGGALHFSGTLQNVLWASRLDLFGNWEEYEPGQGYVPRGTFYTSHGSLRWLF